MSVISTIASAAFGGGELVHDVKSGRLFLLNQTAAEIWRSLRGSVAAESIAQDVIDRYRVDPSIAWRDVELLIARLRKSELVGVAESTTSPAETAEPRPPRSEPSWSGSCRMERVVHVDCHPAGIGRSLGLIVAPATVTGVAAAEADTSLTLFQRAGSYFLLRDGVRIRRLSTAPSARWSLLRQLVLAGRRRHWLALLHAAGVALPAGALILAGGSGSGKSTLLSGLLHAGHGFITDDLLPLEAGTGLIWPVPFAISVKQGSWEIVGSLFPNLADAPAIEFAGRHIRYLAPPEGCVGSLAGYTGAALVFPRYQAGTATTLTPIEPLRALILLGAGGSVLPETDIELAEFLDWLTMRTAYELVYGRLDEAVAQLEALPPPSGPSSSRPDSRLAAPLPSQRATTTGS